MDAVGNTRVIARYIFLDAAVLALACLVPALSHLTALPLYKFNPMLALLLAAMLLGRDWRNALLLAVLLPAVSCIVVGMPAAPKMVCMMAELATVAGVWSVVSEQWSVAGGSWWKTLAAVTVAIVAGKLVYYVLKALVIAPDVLVGTAWWLQLAAALLWAALFAVLYRFRK